MADLSGVSFRLQQHKCMADYNVAAPVARAIGDRVVLCYSPGCSMSFVDVAAYRVGDPNDEGFYGGGRPGILNDSIYTFRSFPDVEWGNFYEVFGFDWSNGLVGEGSVELIAREFWSPSHLRHYVYFMKDGTFECICKRWLEGQ